MISDFEKFYTISGGLGGTAPGGFFLLPTFEPWHSPRFSPCQVDNFDSSYYPSELTASAFD